VSEQDKPYPSWTWVTNEVGVSYWDSPVPMPRNHGKVFVWNEEQLQWKEVE
jgi:hypothetical protein